jgi:predicted enzyme related to lactoylglutathione lyase
MVKVKAPKGEGMSGSIVWFTMSARDPDALAHFYEALLSWEVDEARLTSRDEGVSGRFRVVRSGGLSGSISEENETGVALMVEVDDLDEAVERARALGASVTREDFDLQGLDGEDGRYRTAWMRDPSGNRLALVASAG